MNNNSSTLNLTYQQARQIFDTWMTKLENDSKIPARYYFDTKMTVSDAATKPDGQNGMMVILGIHDISPNTNPDAPVDTKNFVHAAVNLFHESRHVQQEYEERTLTTQQAAALAIADIPYQRNWQTYRRKYLSNFHELDAELSGILSAKDALSKTFPHINCERLIVDYVNDRFADDKIYHIGICGHPTYHSISEIEHAFGLAFSKYETLPHTTIDVEDDDIRHSGPDTLNIIINGSQRTRERWQPFTAKMYPKFPPHPSAKTYDMMATSVMLHAYPEYLKKYNALRNVDLSAETVFGMKFPESTASIRLRLGEPLPISPKKLTKSVRTETTAEQATRPAPRKTLRPRHESVPAPEEPRPAATPPTPPPARRPPARTPTYGPETMRAIQVAGDVSAPDDGLDTEYDE